MCGGKSSGSTSQQVEMTPEQRALLGAQTNFLTNTAFPTYQKTIGMAENAYNQSISPSQQAANTALNVAGQTGALQQAAGTQGLVQGMQGISSLFGPQYEQNQIGAALQAGRESARESQAGQNAMYGAAGGLGSSRMALADQNLASLNAQRQATAAAGAQAQVQQNKLAAGQALLGAGQGNLAAANQAAAARIGYGQTPQDVLAKYASVIYGTPQQSTTPNFANTQNTTGQTSGKGVGFKFS
jgi:hypothetical protein